MIEIIITPTSVFLTDQAIWIKQEKESDIFDEHCQEVIQHKSLSSFSHSKYYKKQKVEIIKNVQVNVNEFSERLNFVILLIVDWWFISRFLPTLQS